MSQETTRSDAEIEISRVLVVDDHRTFAELLTDALNAEADLICVGSAHTSAEAILAVAELAPDIVLMDLNLPDRDGITTTAELTHAYPSLKVLILTAHAGSAEMVRAGAAGAVGFLAKDGSMSDVLSALRSAERGSLILPPAVLASFAASNRTSGRPMDYGLTPRELQVLQLLGQGHDPRAISRELGVSLHTCRSFIKSILAKLQVHTQLEAVVVASRARLIQVGESA